MSKINKRVIIDNPPEITIDENQLQSANFSNGGIARFKETVKQYNEELFKRSSLIGESQKASEDEREISSLHVREAAIDINRRYGKHGNKYTYMQIGEYVCTAVAGAGASHLGSGWGIFIFMCGLTIGTGLFCVRITNQNR